MDWTLQSKKERLIDLIKKQDSIICCLEETQLRCKVRTSWKEKDEKIDHVKSIHKREGIVMLISDEIVLKTKHSGEIVIK